MKPCLTRLDSARKSVFQIRVVAFVPDIEKKLFYLKDK